ncbi:hypothetical protein ACP4OV_016106 [Aristida adscensionis]
MPSAFALRPRAAVVATALLAVLAARRRGGHSAPRGPRGGGAAPPQAPPEPGARLASPPRGAPGALLAVLAAAALLHRRRRRSRAPASPRRPGARRGRPCRGCDVGFALSCPVAVPVAPPTCLADMPSAFALRPRAAVVATALLAVLAAAALLHRRRRRSRAPASPRRPGARRGRPRRGCDVGFALSCLLRLLLQSPQPLSSGSIGAGGDGAGVRGPARAFAVTAPTSDGASRDGAIERGLMRERAQASERAAAETTLDSRATREPGRERGANILPIIQ